MDFECLDNMELIMVTSQIVEIGKSENPDKWKDQELPMLAALRSAGEKLEKEVWRRIKEDPDFVPVLVEVMKTFG